MKRLVVCCDGTWNKLGTHPTNVVKIAQAVKPLADGGVSQVVFYQEGLGTRWYDRLPGGAFGWGIDYNIQNAYQFLCFNYDVGDEIYLFGFSRGAYTARSLAGMLYCCGLLLPQYVEQLPQAYRIYRDRAIKPKSPAAKEFRSKYGVCHNGEDQISITLLGCWDTVGSLGVPALFPLLPIDRWLNARYNFHDKELNRRIQNAIHAVAVDERRKVFDVTAMEASSKNPAQKLRQFWFPGGHGCVGGGTAENCPLSDGALLWMMDEMQQLGLKLEFDLSRVKDSLMCDPTTNFDAATGLYGLAGLHDRSIQGGFAVLHDSVKTRWQRNSEYRPTNLLPFTKELSGE